MQFIYSIGVSNGLFRNSDVFAAINRKQEESPCIESSWVRSAGYRQQIGMNVFIERDGILSIPALTTFEKGRLWNRRRVLRGNAHDRQILAGNV